MERQNDVTIAQRHCLAQNPGGNQLYSVLPREILRQIFEDLCEDLLEELPDYYAKYNARASERAWILRHLHTENSSCKRVWMEDISQSNCISLVCGGKTHLIVNRSIAALLGTCYEARLQTLRTMCSRAPFFSTVRDQPNCPMECPLCNVSLRLLKSLHIMLGGFFDQRIDEGYLWRSALPEVTAVIDELPYIESATLAFNWDFIACQVYRNIEGKISKIRMSTNVSYHRGQYQDAGLPICQLPSSDICSSQKYQVPFRKLLWDRDDVRIQLLFNSNMPEVVHRSNPTEHQCQSSLCMVLNQLRFFTRKLIDPSFPKDDISFLPYLKQRSRDGRRLIDAGTIYLLSHQMPSSRIPSKELDPFSICVCKAGRVDEKGPASSPRSMST